MNTYLWLLTKIDNKMLSRNSILSTVLLLLQAAIHDCTNYNSYITVDSDQRFGK